ncbi:MAG: hypothetical protein M1827_005709 [Pycnora praestabilis]|nr:MAG: hypothetical protein M1827_005709 [Pycnora praestabilis]
MPSITTLPLARAPTLAVRKSTSITIPSPLLPRCPTRRNCKPFTIYSEPPPTDRPRTLHEQLSTLMEGEEIADLVAARMRRPEVCDPRTRAEFFRAEVSDEHLDFIRRASLRNGSSPQQLAQAESTVAKYRILSLMLLESALGERWKTQPPLGVLWEGVVGRRDNWRAFGEGERRLSLRFYWDRGLAEERAYEELENYSVEERGRLGLRGRPEVANPAG